PVNIAAPKGRAARAEAEALLRSNPAVDSSLSNVRNRRISPDAPRPREGPLTEPTAGAQPWPWERVLMPEGV
ncbi:MAG TPA: hypothetical protein VHM88_12165, partial [Candidatus Acidoferrales bacterium]|nr:hypothetical protein [Candidatus Acidoferrales bacterium]